VTTPRRQLVDPELPLFYHLVSRCVSRAWLFGVDPLTNIDYSHRKVWLLDRLKHLGQAFALDVYAYAVMSNHFHLVVYYDPAAPGRWSDLEVVQRWLTVCPPKRPDGSIDEALKALRTAALLDDPEAIEILRSKLGSLSVFMKLLKQPIARRANLEDGRTGHFFEQRFYSGAVLSDASVTAAMAYVDLNPIRAKIAKTIAQAKHTAIYARLQELEGAEDLQAYLAPVISGLGQPAVLKMTLGEYVERLEVLVAPQQSDWSPSKLAKWRDQVATLKRKQRVYGPESLIRAWIEERGWQMREVAVPE